MGNSLHDANWVVALLGGCYQKFRPGRLANLWREVKMTNKSDVSVLCFEGHKVRVVQLSGEPWFIAKDVCEALEVTNHRMSLKALDEDKKGVNLTYTQGGRQLMRTVSESGFYKLIARSRKATIEGTFAHRFTNWVFREVIPSIRKFGAYGIPWALLHDFTQRSDDSKDRGSQAGKALFIRKVEKRLLSREKKLLLERYQPQLALEGVSNAE